jgi:hypothetical protein
MMPARQSTSGHGQKRRREVSTGAGSSRPWKASSAQSSQGKYFNILWPGSATPELPKAVGDFQGELSSSFCVFIHSGALVEDNHAIVTPRLVRDLSKQTQAVVSRFVRNTHVKEVPDKGPVRCTSASTPEGVRVPNDDLLEGSWVHEPNKLATQGLLGAFLPLKRRRPPPRHLFEVESGWEGEGWRGKTVTDAATIRLEGSL